MFNLRSQARLHKTGYSPTAKIRFGALPCFEGLSFFFMDTESIKKSIALGIADDQTENWNFVSVDQFKI